jgi:hypothetical protein
MDDLTLSKNSRQKADALRNSEWMLLADNKLTLSDKIVALTYRDVLRNLDPSLDSFILPVCPFEET